MRIVALSLAWQTTQIYAAHMSSICNVVCDGHHWQQPNPCCYITEPCHNISHTHNTLLLVVPP